MATSVSLIQAIASGLVTSAGVPVASGKVRFYSPGTLTPVTVYSDSAGSTAITQPLTLTAGGTGTVYSRGLVRFIAKDAADTTTILDVVVNSSVSNGVNVEDYGAVGDDATDCTSAFAAAISAAVASPATRIVNVPAGTFRITSALSITVSVIIVGASSATSIIKQVSTTADGFAVTTAPGLLRLRDISVSAASASSGAAVSSTNTSAVTFDNCSLIGFAYGADIRAIRGFRTTFSGSTAGVRVTSGGSTIELIGCTLTSAGSFIMDIATTANAFLVCTSTTQVVPLRATSIGGLYLIGCSLPGAITVSNGANPVFLSGTSFGGGTTTDSRVGTPVVFTLAGTNSVTPLPSQSDVTKIVQSGGAATTTINAPTGTYPFGYLHRVVCSNTSGGALTWTWNAAFKISAAVAPATGNRITVTYSYDPQDATWSEVARSASVPN